MTEPVIGKRHVERANKEMESQGRSIKSIIRGIIGLFSTFLPVVSFTSGLGAIFLQSREPLFLPTLVFSAISGIVGSIFNIYIRIINSHMHAEEMRAKNSERKHGEWETDSLEYSPFASELQRNQIDKTILKVSYLEASRDAEIKRLENELEENKKDQSRLADDLEQEYSQRIAAVKQEKENEIEKIKKDLEIELIQIDNIKGSKDYFKISKYHAKFSFGFSIVACAVGLLLLAAAVILVIARQDYQVAIVPAVGAALANFIAATVFWVHRKSAEQLNRYYDSLHEVEVFLSSAKIIEKITELPVAGVIPYIPFALPEEDSLYAAESPSYSPAAELSGQFDLIAAQVRKALNLELIYKIIADGVENAPG